VQTILCFTPALILTFSPGEKEQQSHAFGFANEHPGNSVALKSSASFAA
jgi:hypothetical protein